MPKITCTDQFTPLVANEPEFLLKAVERNINRLIGAIDVPAPLDISSRVLEGNKLIAVPVPMGLLGLGKVRWDGEPFLASVRSSVLRDESRDTTYSRKVSDVEANHGEDGKR